MIGIRTDELQIARPMPKLLDYDTIISQNQKGKPTGIQ